MDVNEKVKPAKKVWIILLAQLMILIN